MPVKIDVKTSPEITEDISSLTKNPEVSNFYINSLQVGYTLTEGHIILKEHNVPVAVVNIPFPLIKALHTQLGGLIEHYENFIGEKIKTIEQLTPKQPAK